MEKCQKRFSTQSIPSDMSQTAIFACLIAIIEVRPTEFAQVVQKF